MFKLLTFKSDGAFWPQGEQPGRAEASQAGGVAALLTLPRRLVGAIVGEFGARRAMRSLAGLDDRMLRDIGVERGQIERVCRYGRDIRPSDLRADVARWS